MDLALLTATRPEWISAALRDMDAVLVDHAHCEKKAAAHALSMLGSWAFDTDVAHAMAVLAREESAHLAEVLTWLDRRGLALGGDPGDPYAQGLFAQARSGGAGRRLDLLLISGLIELRSEERLRLLAENLQDPELGSFYRRLSLSERGHASLFFGLAERTAAQEGFSALAKVWLERESELMNRLPVRPAIH